MPSEAQLKYVFEQIGYKPSAEQQAVHESEARIRLVAGGERALALDTPVPTPSGWTTIGQLSIGDLVFTQTGQPCHVIHKTSVFYNEPCFSILFDTGETIIADAQHLWAIQSANERRNSNRFKSNGVEYYREPSLLINERKHSIRTTEELTKNTSIDKPKTQWGTKSMSNYSVTCCLPVQYQEKTLVIAPYVLGAWLGDGTTLAGAITSADSEVINKISKCDYVVKKTKAPYGYKIFDLSKQLRELGVLGNKHIPQVYLQSSIEQRMELLHGLMDTDGGGEHKGNEFYNKNEILIDNFRELLASLGIKSWKRQKEAKLYGKPCGIAYTVSFSSRIPAFLLGRKLKRQNLSPTGHTRNHYIRKISPVNSVPVQCISVDSEDNLFLIGKSFIPTHNSGKSFLSANDLTARMFGGKLFWLTAADYERTKAEYNYIIENLVKMGIAFSASKQIDPGEIIIPELDIRIATKSSKDPRKLAMEAPDGILACEASQLDFETFLRLRGRVIERRGWLLLSGTFESSLGWYVDMYQLGQTTNNQDLVSFSLPTWSNLAIFPGGRTDPEIATIEAMFTKEWFMERFGGVPTPPRGLVFPEFKTNIHTGITDMFRLDTAAPCYIWVDPGYAAPYSILVGQKRDEETIAVVDEIYETGLVTEDMITLCQKKPWWKLVVGGAIDVAGTQHQAMSSPQETWLKQGRIALRSQKVRIQDGIERMKTSLKVNPLTNKPGLYINTKCKGLISELGGCPSPIDGQTKVYKWRMDRDGNVIGDTPDDKNNHSIKALTYGLVDLLGFVSTPRAKTKIFYTKPAKK